MKQLEEGWREATLAEICEIRKGQSITSKNVDPGEIPVIAGGQRPAYFHNQANCQGKTITVSASGAYAGYVNYFEVPIFASDCSIIKARNKDVSTKFVYYALKAQQQVIYSFQKGGGQPHVYPKDLMNLKVILPPLPVQRRIVPILERVERARDLRMEVAKLTHRFLNAVFLHMFGDPVSNRKGWEARRLQEVSRISRGRFTPRPRNDPKYFGGEYPFIQTGDISSANHRLSIYSQTLNELGIKVSKKFEKGTVVIAIVGATIGETAVLRIDTYATDSVIGIVPNPKFLTSEYLEMVLCFWKPIFKIQAPEVARANINNETLKSVTIPLPPLELQHKFTSVARQIEKVIEYQMQSSKELDILFGSLTQAFFQRELRC